MGVEDFSQFLHLKLIGGHNFKEKFSLLGVPFCSVKSHVNFIPAQSYFISMKDLGYVWLIERFREKKVGRESKKKKKLRKNYNFYFFIFGS